jgi:site-specific DNA recombinase
MRERVCGNFFKKSLTNSHSLTKSTCLISNIQIPMKRLDHLVLKTMSEKIFTPARVEDMMKQLQARLKKGQASTGNQLKALTKELNNMDQKLQRLYDAYENGFLPMDITLKERAQGHKARREEILIEMARLKQRNEMPLSKFGIKQIVSFCKTLKERFRDRSSKFGKEYLRLLIDEIKFAGQEVIIRGNYGVIPEAMQKTKPSTLQRVPGFGISRVPSTDSNRGPSG